MPILAHVRERNRIACILAIHPSKRFAQYGKEVVNTHCAREPQPVTSIIQRSPPRAASILITHCLPHANFDDHPPRASHRTRVSFTSSSPRLSASVLALVSTAEERLQGDLGLATGDTPEGERPISPSFCLRGSGRALWPVRDLWRLSVVAGVAAPQSIRNFPVGKTRRMCQQLSKSILERCHDDLSPIKSTFRIASTASSICSPVHRPALATSGRLDVSNQRNAKQMQSHRMKTSPSMEKGAIPVS